MPLVASTGPVLEHNGMFIDRHVIKAGPQRTHPHRHAIMGQYRVCTGPMLPASAQYSPGTGNLWHIYRVCFVHNNVPSVTKLLIWLKDLY